VKTAISLAIRVKSRRNRSFSMKEMNEIIARALVDEPELVSIGEVGGIHRSILELTVAETDIGKVVGKQAVQPMRCGLY